MVKLWEFLSVSIVLAALPKAVSGSPPADEWSYEIQPGQTKVGLNTDFTVNVSAVRWDGNATTFNMALAFNATLLNVTGVDRPDFLPNGDVPDGDPMCPCWDNETGMVAERYSMQPPYTVPYVNETFTMCTIHFRSLGVAGTSDLKFANVDANNFTKIKFGPGVITNWTKMVNGTVKVGPPVLTVNVTPDGKGDVNISGVIPSSYPNITSWSWNQHGDLV